MWVNALLFDGKEIDQFEGPYQSRHAGLLQRQWLLHPKAVVI